MLLTTSLKDLYPKIWALVQISIACENLILSSNNLAYNFVHSRKYWIYIRGSNVHGNKLNGTIPSAFQDLESMTYL